MSALTYRSLQPELAVVIYKNKAQLLTNQIQAFNHAVV